jgi:hypothetical protein
LSIFYKLASACITTRIKPTVSHIIGEEEKAYSAKKNFIMNLMDRTITKKEAGLILLIDFKKAFDSISHKFIFNTLQTLNFGSVIINWIHTFLTNRTAQILLGGHLTEPIQLEQGPRTSKE